MAHEGPQASLLLQLPDPCLLAVLQCLADDPASLCNTARAHSRLHQAAVLALSSISAVIRTQQLVDDSLLPYLSKYGQHVNSMGIYSLPHVTLRQLGPMVQLTQLHLRQLGLQLQAGDGFQGVLGLAGLPLKQLQLNFCTLLGGQAGLAGALSPLPGLEHLCMHYVMLQRQGHVEIGFPSEMLQPLQQLTYLEVAGRCESRQGIPQSLKALTRLAHLDFARVHGMWPLRLEADTLSTSQLTHMALPGGVLFAPGVLAGKTRLQHLHMPSCRVDGGAAGVAQLLSELQHLQQLTHLNLSNGLCHTAAVNESNRQEVAAAFSALTASSKLQHLDISRCTLPTGVWEHLFPAGRQLPDLPLLQVSYCRAPSGGFAAAPEGSFLARCCPGLQSLYMLGLKCGVGHLAALSRLTGLHTLHVTVDEGTDQQVWDCCQLTGLRQLNLEDNGYADADGLLLQLTQLRHLQRLNFTVMNWEYNEAYACEDQETYPRELEQCGPDDEPVWRQLLQHYLDHPQRDVAQEAAEGLEDSDESSTDSDDGSLAESDSV